MSVTSLKPKSTNQGYGVESADGKTVLFGFTLIGRPKNERKS